MEQISRKRQKAEYPLTLDGQTCPSGKRTVRSKAEHLAVEHGKLVECANTLSLDDFTQIFLPKDTNSQFELTSEHGADHGELIGNFTDAKHAPFFVGNCLNLVELTSKDDYANSEVGWSRAKKRIEMLLPDQKYFVLGTRAIPIIGFITFMVTYEDGHEVLYVYEIHLEPEFQGKGLGRKLMAIAEQTGRNVGLEKVMLTVFRSNEKAIGMYRKLGYSVDVYSPQPRILRNGTLKESGYVVLSKSLKTPPVEKT